MTPRGRAALQFFWFVAAPSVLAVVATRLLLPDPGQSAGWGNLARLIVESPLMVGVALLLLFAGLARYWRYHLPGGRRLFPLAGAVPAGAGPELLRACEPAAELVRLLSHPRQGPRASKHLGPAEREALAVALAAVRQALAAGDPGQASASAEAVGRILRPTPAAQRRHALRQAATLVLTVGVAAVLAMVMRGSLVETFRVSSASMLPTLLPYDRLVASKLGRRAGVAPRRGEVVVFRPPEATGRRGPDEMVKRVVGLPGDRITMRNGHPVINGWRVPFCDAGTYAYPRADGGTMGRLVVEFLEDQVYLTVHTGQFRQFPGVYLVKPGEVFVLGDNRNQSVDSRVWGFGRGAGVPLARLDGRVARVVGSDRNGGTDWSRIWKPLGLEVTLPGTDARQLQAGVERCLQSPPASTRPPAA